MEIIEYTPLPAAISAEDSAIPCFIGYTEQVDNGKAQRYKPVRIASPVEYASIFGRPPSVRVELKCNKDNTLNVPPVVIPSPFRLPYAVQHYFQNGGGPCYILSVGSFRQARMYSARLLQQQLNGLRAAAREEKITLLVVPDAALLQGTEAYYTLLREALKQCAEKRDRFALLDIWLPSTTATIDTLSAVTSFRSGIGSESLSFGAAYYPWLRTTLLPFIDQESPMALRIRGGSGLTKEMVVKQKEDSMDFSNSLYHQNRPLYDAVIQAVRATEVILPPSAAVAGTYAKVDREKGVWKAPANVSVAAVKAPLSTLSQAENDQLTIDPVGGKSINAIRTFAGKGVLLWGARTLAGNDNEWRYVPVRRFFMMVEESVGKGTAWVIFEPNEAGTWMKLKGLTENFLTQLWRQGALQGSKPEEAFYVAAGLGKTMTALDIAEGRLILEIGIAPVRPAEFIILRISYKMNPGQVSAAF